MKIYLNDEPIDLPPGTTVRHALIRGKLLDELAQGKKVYDEWGNEVGLDGALSEGAKIFLR
ncbi:MAG TPA: hypothetical protein VLS90_10555 [Thermodesulfobacteriota bacterium]|nr:hypothetical protein [Thermodesulfobacteriota bacterium]